MFENVSLEQRTLMVCAGPAGTEPEQRLQWHRLRQPTPSGTTWGEQGEEIPRGDPFSSAPSKTNLRVTHSLLKIKKTLTEGIIVTYIHTRSN